MDEPKKIRQEKNRAVKTLHCPTIEEFGHKKANVEIVDTFQKKEQAAVARGHRKSMNVDVVKTTRELKLK